MQKQLIINLSEEDLRQLLRESVAEALSQNDAQPAKASTEQTEEVITQNEVLAMLGITAPTLRAWVKKGIIPRHEIEGRVYYFRSEVVRALRGNRLANPENGSGHER